MAMVPQSTVDGISTAPERGLGNSRLYCAYGSSAVILPGRSIQYETERADTGQSQGPCGAPSPETCDTTTRGRRGGTNLLIAWQQCEVDLGSRDGGGGEISGRSREGICAHVHRHACRHTKSGRNV